MRARTVLAAAIAAVSLGFLSADALAARQTVALFPPEPVGVENAKETAKLLGKALAEKLEDRFSVFLVDEGVRNDPEAKKRRARAFGASYTLEGTVSRIGRTVTLDLTLAPTEDPNKGRTVFVTGTDSGPTPEAAAPAATGELPFVYRRMAIESTAKLKLLFFGDGKVGEGAGKKTIPSLSGNVSSGRNTPGDAVSVAMGDTDRDGKPEVVAAYGDALAVYRVEGDDLREKVRIPQAGGGMIHVDVGDVNRNGIAEIVAVRYIAGRALSDIWEFDGKQYRRIAADVPVFLRTVDLGPHGIVLVGQESDPVTVFKGSVFRAGLTPDGPVELQKEEGRIPLPDGTWIYSFVPLKHGKNLRYATLSGKGWLALHAGNGEKLWEGIDVISGTETVLEAPLSASGDVPGPLGGETLRLPLPNRLFAADLTGDKSDELVVVNNIVSAGGFFENLRIYSNAEALCFAQVGDTLQLAWRTPQIGNSAVDAFLDMRSPGKSFRLGVAARDKGKILGRFGEWRLLWVR